MPRADDFRAFDGTPRQLGTVMSADVLDGKVFIAAAHDGHHASAHRNGNRLAVVQVGRGSRIDPFHEWCSRSSLRITSSPSHHAGLQPRLIRHHGLVPRRVEDQFHVGPRHGRNDFNLAAHVLDQGLAHAAAGRGQGHFNVDRAGRIVVLGDFTLVHQPQVDNVYRDLGVVASLELLPDDALDVLFGGAGRYFGCQGRCLTDRVRIMPGDAEQVSVDVYGEAAAQRLRDIAHRTQFQVDFDPGGYGNSLDVALHDDGFIFVRMHCSSNLTSLSWRAGAWDQSLSIRLR